MSSEDAEHQSAAEHVENAPVDETVPNAEEPVAAPQEAAQDETSAEPVEAHEGNAAGENAGEENDEAGEDLADPRVFKMAAREVDECYMTVIRGLSAFTQEDEELFKNAVDICNDIISMEQNLFSEPPSYVADYIATYRAKTDAYNSTVQPRQTIPTAEGTPRDWEERRAYVDPGVPLMLPYDAERFKKDHPKRAQSEGTYHDLFYGDGSKVVFAPPADNKRKQIEEKQKNTYHPSRRPPLSFEPQQKKPLRVSADFVPSCAEVKNPQKVRHTKPVKKVQSTKGKRKSVSKQ
jgi:ribosomal protein L12E/L44/L45/RPP1/RPP2